MIPVTAIVIGAGHAGLAMSHCLGRRGIDHLVLERGRVAERWCSERWDSLRLLTPNWMARLPGGWSYRGPDPDGFMTMPEVIDYLDSYARASAAPVREGTAVRAVRRAGEAGFRVETGAGETWLARVVVVATGHCDVPLVPAMARGLPASIHQLVPSRYRSPAALPDGGGGVLVVGASASGLQIAEELHQAGRAVSLAVGRHVRVPRSYRGRDIWWWLDRIGALDEDIARVGEAARDRARTSMQLIGSPERRTLDLGVLHARGVRILGHAAAVEGGATMRFADDLAETVGSAQRALERLLARIDATADAIGAPPPEADALRPVRLGPPSPPGGGAIDLAAEGIRTVLWATGYARDYRWLQLPGALDAAGEIRHDGGITPVPGLYVLGLRFLRRRKSSFLDGAGGDAEALAGHILGHLAATPISSFADRRFAAGRIAA